MKSETSPKSAPVSLSRSFFISVAVWIGITGVDISSIVDTSHYML